MEATVEAMAKSHTSRIRPSILAEVFDQLVQGALEIARFFAFHHGHRAAAHRAASASAHRAAAWRAGALVLCIMPIPPC